MEKRDLLLSCCRILHEQSQYAAKFAYSMVTMRSDASDDSVDRAIDIISPMVMTMCEMMEAFPAEPVAEYEINQTLRLLSERIQPQPPEAPNE